MRLGDVGADSWLRRTAESTPEVPHAVREQQHAFSCKHPSCCWGGNQEVILYTSVHRSGLLVLGLVICYSGTHTYRGSVVGKTESPHVARRLRLVRAQHRAAHAAEAPLDKSAGGGEELRDVALWGIRTCVTSSV